jgi:3-hydroxypropanoate dehydrogenase
MPRILSDESLDTLFRNAAAEPLWLDRPVGDTLLKALWELVKLGPVSNRSGSARILFLRSPEAKERLALALPPEERAALRPASIAAILASELGVATDGALTVAEALPRALALRDGALRGAYLTLAARSLGLACRPIWDFNAETVQAAFFPEGMAIASFLCALGYSDETRSDPTPPRRDFDEACQIL